ncbi:MAG TPA: GMC family oxidoreductase [Polyangiales bacterium]|nr:GMC family oxidoreductase [Polyangiales bacterium]
MTHEIELDVLIVGSGAGGGTVAARLASLCASGARIAVAEAGPWYGREHFNMRERDMIGLFVDRGAVPAANFEIAVSAGRCVGGSTSVYTGVTFRTPGEVLQDWGAGAGDPGLEDDVLARFERLEQEIDAHFPDPASYENENNRVFRAGCERLGWPVGRFRVNIRDCRRCGFCNLGCPYGSKRGTLEVQLPAALAQGVELIANCAIERVWDGGASGVIAPAPSGTRAGTRTDAHPAGAVRFKAKHVVLAGGTLGTPALLLRSRLPQLSPACGRYVTLHPALTSFGQMRDEVRGFDGFPKLYYTDQWSAEHHYYLESAFYFPFVTARSLPGFGAELKQAMRGYGRLACALTLVHDAAERENRIALRGDRALLEYRLSQQTRRALVHAQQRAGELFFAAGAERYFTPVSERFAIERADQLARAIDERALQSGRVVVSSAHPMGGCAMSSDFELGVTDSYGVVHGHPGLVVADGSLFPSSSKVNPYLTIMALAERCAEQLRARL